MTRVGSEAIRETFLGFFEKNGHARIAGAPVVPKNDPTLLFINSGMAPLKPYFTGEVTPAHPDLCNYQACIRTKDIEDVGDRHHLTFFEMLGSWSIGNYFKDHAIELAYGLLTDGFKLKPSQLYVTVFAGDPALGIPADEESAAAWERVGISRDHIVALPAEDNFWGPAGNSGPCGPCTEVFLDTGDAFGPAYVPGGEFDTKRRYIEIWNAGVFMQFNKGLDGTFQPLPFTSVDTGSGLERLELALNGLDTVYESDLLAPVVTSVQEMLGETGEIQRHHRLIADHMRASTIILADGARPSNEGRGYIPRRLVRKCVTVALSRGHDTLNFEPVLDVIIDRLGPHYPRIAGGRDMLTEVIRAERDDFGRTVRRGMERLDGIIAGKGAIDGADAFNMFATYGLPVEITKEIAAERGVEVSLDDYEKEFRQHQVRSRGVAETASGPKHLKASDVLPGTIAKLPRTDFLGYDGLTTQARVLAILVNGNPVETLESGVPADLIVDRTPFYAEGGGQVGDSGELVGTDAHGRITSTLSHSSGHSTHHVTLIDGSLAVGDQIELSVEAYARVRTAANHSATHLLNAALRRVLGDHVTQAGSLVEPERLRFDFTHPTPMTAEQIEATERLVNDWILTGAKRHVDIMTPDEAKAQGAISLAGEAYGDEVRVVSFGSMSKELCGGTHVDHTTMIGSFRITTEQSVAAGVRRINAVTRDGAINYALEQTHTLREVSSVLRSNPRDAAVAAQRLLDRVNRKGSGAAEAGQPATVRPTLDTTVGDVRVVAGKLNAEMPVLRTEAQRLSAEHNGVVMLWNTADNGKTTVVVSLAPAVAARLNATAIVRDLTGRVGGSGGGSPAIAQGGVPALPAGTDLGQELVTTITALTAA
jgi:alanyl-tRNA synthetase